MPSFLSEALGFSAGNICVMTMTAFAVFNPTFSVYTQYVRFSCFLLVVFVLWFVVGFLGMLLCDWKLVFWFLGLFRGVLTVFWVCLGFLLPPCAFCGPSILLWGRV